MSAAQPSYDEFERTTPLGVLGASWPYALGLLLFLAFAWFVWSQLTAVEGVKVEAPPPQVVAMLPPPPPPPPPPPEPVKPPEPTEQPQPSPAEAPKTPQQQQAPAAAPMTMNADAQTGGTIAAGSGQGIGSPSSTGTCLGTKCGAASGGGGMTEGFYRTYLSGVLQDRVRRDDKLSRLVFTADLALTVTPGGQVTGVRFLSGAGKNDDATIAKLKAILEQVGGLTPPPGAMQFPQKVTVRGRRAL